jgi:hypothetical protein
MRDVHAVPGFAITLDPSPGRPAALLARAELHVLEGPLTGLALRGFSLWRAPSGVRVTPPRLSSSQPFLRTSRIALPGLGDQALRTIFDAILAAHSQTTRTTLKEAR